VLPQLPDLRACAMSTLRRGTLNTPIPNLSARAVIATAGARCPESCGWVGQLGKLEAQWAQCPQALVPCPVDAARCQATLSAQVASLQQ